MRPASVLVSLVATAAAVRAQNSTSTVLRTCPSTGLCYALNIPDSTAQAGTGSIFFQISAPTTNTWAAIAQGEQMAGANMFVMYQNADGSNVTVSPRAGTGEVMPLHDTYAQITLLEGSGISDGMMVANIRCDNCTSWSGGSLNYKGSSSSWLYAARPGSPLMSDDLGAVIEQHDAHGTFSFNTPKAIGGPDSNPFVEAASNGSSSGDGSGSSSGSDDDDGGSSNIGRLILVHGSLAGVAFVALFPLGAVLMRIPGIGSARANIHGGVQVFAYLVFIAAAGIGIHIAKTLDLLNHAHPIIGLVLLALLFFQPFFGHLHHILYKRRGRRTIVSHLHANTGRALILLGIINGGLGLQLAGATTKSMIAYGVLGGLVGVLYIVMFVLVEAKMPRGGDVVETEKRGADASS
ncbi:hypothetical protein ANO11243_071560 [Dothideomycetidae sp. 11243]|nr:hypothetical protein ANO11243_071560 [fungal sp. No.11243]